MGEVGGSTGVHQLRILFPFPERKTKMKRTEIVVTQSLIENAERRDSSHCMIAEALKEAVPNTKFVSVDLQSIRYTADGWRYLYLTPRKAQEALIAFDSGSHTEPFTFELRTLAYKRKVGPVTSRKVVGGSSGHIPTVVGGPMPPTAPKNGKGRRREYGLRSYTQ